VRVAAPGADLDAGRARRWLLVVCAVALLLRVVYVLQSRASPLFDAPQMDALYHLEWARAFARGEEYQDGPFFRAPLYPWFLGLLLRVFGEDLLLVRLVQAVLGTLSVALTARVAALVFDRRAGLVAAALAATYWILIYFDGELLLPVLEVLLDLAAIERTLVAGRSGKRPAWLVAGAAWGVAALVRPNVLAFVPVLVLWSLRRPGGSPAQAEGRRARAARALAFAGGVALAIAPVTAWNVLAEGDRVLISSQGGVNLWIGNNPQSDGSSAIVPGTRPDWWGGYHDSIALVEREAGRALRPSEVSAAYTAKALAWMRAEPAAALAHLAWKTRLFWADFELGNNVDERFFALRYGPILRWLPITFGVVAPLGLLGLVLAWRRLWSAAPLLLFVPVYAATVIAFFVCARFRVPVVPPLCIAAAYALVRGVDTWRAGARGRVLLACAPLALLALAIGVLPAGIRRSDAQGWHVVGSLELGRERWTAAEEAFRAGLREDPRLAILHEGLGAALAGQGRDAEALESFRTALRTDARASVGAALGALEILRRHEAWEDALRVARDLGALLPASARGPYEEGRTHHARWLAARLAGAAPPEGELERAAAAFERARRLGLEGTLAFDVPFAAGTIALERGDARSAAEAFEAALAARREPDAEGWWFQALRGLARALGPTLPPAEARARLAPHLERAARDPRTAAVRAELLGPP
jgi:tetratricopeptide (TPR) repeat protein